jgi:hypothetical protein
MSSRQKTTQADPKRPLTATENATAFRVGAPQAPVVTEQGILPRPPVPGTLDWFGDGKRPRCPTTNSSASWSEATLTDPLG